MFPDLQQNEEIMHNSGKLSEVSRFTPENKTLQDKKNITSSDSHNRNNIAIQEKLLVVSS